MKRRAFSIPEMLAVVAIIVIILGILLPALQHGKEWARDAECRSNQRQIGLAFRAYAVDHNQTLPPNTNGTADGDWLTFPPPPMPLTSDNKWASAPQTGSIYPYVSHNPKVFLCPSLAPGELGSGKGSNGRFDITAFSGFSGAKLFNISLQGRVDMSNGAGSTWQDIVTPLIIEEDPKELNGNNREGHFANVDLFGQWHHDGGSFASIDGSVHRLDYPEDQISVFGRDFQSITRRGTWQTIGPSGPPVGWWNSQ